MLYQSFVTAGAPDPAVVESEDEPEQDSLQPNTQPDPIEVGCACFTFFYILIVQLFSVLFPKQ